MIQKQKKEKVLVIGSGPIVIGQGAEFDYAGTQACQVLREAGFEIILVNNNPATVMTDEETAHTIYFEPLTVSSVTQIIQKERPKWLLASVSGQTGLTLATNLEKEGILKKYSVHVLGTSIDAMQMAEDREQFRQVLYDLHVPVLDSAIVSSVNEAVEFGCHVTGSIIVRPAYTLGGTGGGIAHTEESLRDIVTKGLQESPIGQCLLEQSIAGWKEIEFEVIRDAKGHVKIVCEMENIDPVGVHTGESIVVIPPQTIVEKELNMLEDAATAVVNQLEIVGACNVQFALHPTDGTFHMIEVNPRVSRSSALASKVIGFPIAQIATEMSIGKTLDQMKHPVSNQSIINHDFVIDYVGVKFPRWVFDTFPHADRSRGTQMKATGEVVVFEKTLERALHKAVRSLDEDTIGIRHVTCMQMNIEELWSIINAQEDRTFFAMIECLYKGISVDELCRVTGIDTRYVTLLQTIVQKEKQIQQIDVHSMTKEQLYHVKQMGYADEQLASIWQVSEELIREKRYHYQLFPALAHIQANEREAYYYTTWDNIQENRREKSSKRIIMIGSGPIRIGQGIEFDYCSVHAVKAYQRMGYEVIFINNNPATVSTDFTIADKLYMEPLTVEDIWNIAMYEQADKVSVQFGGQTALNLAQDLEEIGIPLLGTTHAEIERMEDRDHFYQFMKQIDVPHIPGSTAQHREEMYTIIDEIGYPVLLRPSYVIGGKGMVVLHNEQELAQYEEAYAVTYPILVDAYIHGIELEVDVLTDGVTTYVPTIFEHVEKAGVHSGDSIAIAPPDTLSKAHIDQVMHYIERISKGIGKPAIYNMQLVLQQNKLLVLEINPRASRTIPMTSKIVGTNLIDLAVQLFIGKDLASIAPSIGLGEDPPFFAMKGPVYSTVKLPGVDPMLQPEMQSTGEVLAIGSELDELAFKSFMYSEQFTEKWHGSDQAICIQGKTENHFALKTTLVEAGWNVLLEEDPSKINDWINSGKGIALISWETDSLMRTIAEQKGLIVLSTVDTAILFAQAKAQGTIRSVNEWEQNKRKEVVL